MSCDTVLKIIYQACRAVQHMHKQKPPIIHRDLKVGLPVIGGWVNSVLKDCDWRGISWMQLYWFRSSLMCCRLRTSWLVTRAPSSCVTLAAPPQSHIIQTTAGLHRRGPWWRMRYTHMHSVMLKSLLKSAQWLLEYTEVTYLSFCVIQEAFYCWTHAMHFFNHCIALGHVLNESRCFSVERVFTVVHSSIQFIIQCVPLCHACEWIQTPAKYRASFLHQLV